MAPIELQLNQKKQAAILSELVWKLKDLKIEYNLSYNIIERAQPYSPTKKEMQLLDSRKIFYPQNESNPK